jgi:hypothetical protein
MTEPKVHFITLEMSSLDEYSQRELTAYRNIGTIKELRRLKHEDMNRCERRRRFNQLLNDLLAGAIFALSLCVCLFLIALFA